MSQKPTLVILAAGMGSRFGGLKQIEPIGPHGEIIIDYSIYDSKKYGFGKVVFIIKKENEQSFKEAIGDRVSKHIEVEYVFQELADLPEGYSVPDGRVKPWGTGHALLCCKDVIRENFAVINADDFYGPSAFRLLAEFLTKDENIENAEKPEFCLVTYSLGNTLSEIGTVSRGVCAVDNKGFLQTIDETKKIQRVDGEIVSFDANDNIASKFPDNTPVSMQTWGFTPALFDRLEKGFLEFLDDKSENPLTGEYFIPVEIDKMINANEVDVKTLASVDSWFGITYKEDRELAVNSIDKMVQDGIYPEKLWS